MSVKLDSFGTSGNFSKGTSADSDVVPKSGVDGLCFVSKDVVVVVIVEVFNGTVSVGVTVDVVFNKFVIGGGLVSKGLYDIRPYTYRQYYKY